MLTAMNIMLNNSINSKESEDHIHVNANEKIRIDKNNVIIYGGRNSHKKVKSGK